MEVRLIAPGEVTAKDRERWRRCAAAALEPNPFLEPDWLLPALSHLGGSGEVAIVVAEQGGEFHAVVPLRTEAEPGSAHSVLNTRAVPVAAPLGTPLVRADGAADTLGRVLAEIRRLSRRRRSDLVVLEWLVEDGPVAALLRQAAALGGQGAGLVAFDSWERGLLWRQGGDDEYWWRQIGSHHRRTIGQHRARLAVALDQDPTPELRTDFSAVEQFLHLEMSGWKGHRPDGQALGRTSASAGFFRDVSRTYLDAGRMGFLALNGPEGPIAMLCCVRAGQGLFTFRTAYDERVARYGPGVLLYVDAMEYFHRRTDAAWLDSCAAPGNEHLLALLPDRRSMTTLIDRPGALGRRAV